MYGLDTERMLEIKNLHACVVKTKIEILSGLDLKIEKGEVAAIMGPNGSGKSTLSHIIVGHNDYEITNGDIFYDGCSLLSMDTVKRAVLGIFLAFQYPIEIPGVAMTEFLRVAINAQRKARGDNELGISDLLQRIKTSARRLQMNFSMLKRQLNVGFSGGEKKRAEILQMLLLEPKVCILDETDSGLDIDALKIVAEGVNFLRSPERLFLVITHYQRLLDYIIPDTVHVLYKGRIVKSGDKSLGSYLEKNGYVDIIGKEV